MDYVLISVVAVGLGAVLAVGYHLEQHVRRLHARIDAHRLQDDRRPFPPRGRAVDVSAVAVESAGLGSSTIGGDALALVDENGDGVVMTSRDGDAIARTVSGWRPATGGSPVERAAIIDALNSRR